TGALKTAVETCMMNGQDDSTTPPCELGWTESNLIGEGETGGGGGGETGGGFNPQTGLAVEIDLDANTASIVADFGGNAAAPLREATLTWTRANTWSRSCGTTVEAKYAPPGCEATAAN